MLKNNQILAFDYLRAIAALVVFLSHGHQIFLLPVTGLGTWQYFLSHYASDTAVIVFFVLSGYVITSSISNNISRNNGYFSLPNYALNRFLRIYPPFITAVFISLIIFWALTYLDLPGITRPLGAENDIYQARDFIDVTLRDIFNALTLNNGLLQINGPLWSLYIEIKLYIAGGLIAFVLATKDISSNKRIILLCASLVIIVIFLNTYVMFYYGAWWMLGVLYFYLKSQHIPKLKKILFSLILLGILLIGNKEPVVTILQFSMISIIFIVIFLYKFNSYPRLTQVSNFSYTLYILHFPLLIFAYAIFSEYNYHFSNFYSRLLILLVTMLLIFNTAKTLGKYVEDVTLFRKFYFSILKMTRYNSSK